MAGSGDLTSYGVRTRATRGSALRGASARSTSSRKARSVARRVALLRMSSNETGGPGSCRAISEAARPDSVVVSMVPASSEAPWIRMTEAGASERAEAARSHQRKRYTHRPHAPSMSLIVVQPPRRVAGETPTAGVVIL